MRQADMVNTGLCVVMHVTPQICEYVLNEMRALGLNPVALSEPNSPALYDPAIQPARSFREGGTPLVYIAVPRDQRLAGERFAAQWMAKQRSAARKISADTARMALIALVPGVIAGISALWLNCEIETIIIYSVLACTAAFIFMIVRAQRRSGSGAMGDRGRSTETS